MRGYQGLRGEGDGEFIEPQRGDKVIQKIPAHSKSNSKVGKGSGKQGEKNLFS